MAMRQYSTNIPPPEKVRLVGNVANNWQMFRRNFLNYSIGNRLSKEDNSEYQISVFLAMIGQDVFDIYDGLEFDNEVDKMNLEIVMKRLEDFFVGEMHEALELYKFHLQKQEPTENIETYIAALRQLAKNCNFSQLRDRLIKDQVIVRVRDTCIREKLLSDKQLTLDKCQQIGRAHETSKQQTKAISSSTDTEMQVNRVNKNLNKRDPNKNRMEKKYIRCRKFPVHNRNDCPAIYVCCRQCSKIRHYAKVCKTKSEVKKLKEDNFLGSITLDKIDSVKGVEGLEWQAKIKVTTKVCSKITNFRLDTGADMTVIPKSTKLNGSQYCYVSLTIQLNISHLLTHS